MLLRVPFPTDLGGCVHKNTECASAFIMKGKRCHMRLLIGHGSSSRFIKTFASNPLASACPPAVRHMTFPMNQSKTRKL